MSSQEIERLTRSNTKLEELVKQQQRKIIQLETSVSSSSELISKLSIEKENLQLQIKELRRREEQKEYQQQETENRFYHVIKKLEDEIEQRGHKYTKLEQKIQPFLDTDSIRLKILSEVSETHFLELEEYKRKINNLKDEVLKYKRENEMLKFTIETRRIEYQDELRKVKNEMENWGRDRHLNELTYEMCTEIENRLKANYEEAKKECDYYKNKYFESEKRYQERVALLEKEVMIAKQQILSS